MTMFNNTLIFEQPARPILTTERLVLRTWMAEDVAAMAAISADAQVMRYFPQTQSLEQTMAFIAHIHRHYEQYGYMLYAVELKESGQFIGFVGLNVVKFAMPTFVARKLPSVEIGWRLAAAYTHHD